MQCSHQEVSPLLHLLTSAWSRLDLQREQPDYGLDDQDEGCTVQRQYLIYAYVCSCCNFQSGKLAWICATDTMNMNCSDPSDCE